MGWLPHNFQEQNAMLLNSASSADNKNELVAVKECSIKTTNRKKFSRELSVIKQLTELNSSCTVNYLGWSLDQKNYYLLMEYLFFGSLDQFINTNQHLDINIRINMMIDAAMAVDFMHQHQLIHCDIKSPNFLVSENNKLKLGDFGASLSFDEAQRGGCYGTTFWMAPEVVNSHDISTASDVFSLTIVLWELLALKKPYTELHEFVVLHFVCNKKYRMEIPAVAPEACQEKLTKLINYGWVHHPKKRLSANTILHDLQLIQAELKLNK